MSLIDSIVKAWEAGYTIFYPSIGKVQKTGKKLTVGNAYRKSVKENQRNIQHHFPGEPDKDAKCLLIYPENSAERAFATAFSKYKSIETPIGKLTELKINDDDGIEITFNDAESSIKLNKDELILTFDSQEIILDSEGITINGDTKIDGTLKVTGEITAQSDTKMVKVSTHGHTTALGPTIAPVIADLG
ncbi:MAG: hypothetical protein AAF518_17535 [Spirochaetota bacterium]